MSALPRGRSGTIRGIAKHIHGLFPGQLFTILYKLLFPIFTLRVATPIDEFLILPVGNLKPVDVEGGKLVDHPSDEIDQLCQRARWYADHAVACSTGRLHLKLHGFLCDWR